MYQNNVGITQTYVVFLYFIVNYPFLFETFDCTLSMIEFWVKPRRRLMSTSIYFIQGPSK